MELLQRFLEMKDNSLRTEYKNSLGFNGFCHAFSNASSNCLPEKVHNYTGTGYICSTFLQCVFSNVPLKHLPERMHNHIGCICMTFLHCVFSDEF